uniref:GDT1 family protein n=1 Tax=Lygus hesperus TaxID=30085 RepID=A0A0A9WY82_LYGHE
MIRRVGSAGLVLSALWTVVGSVAVQVNILDEVIDVETTTDATVTALDDNFLSTTDFEEFVDVQNKSIGIGFVHGFIASSTVIIVSEIADKTFFIAAIMAMKHSRLAVFFGAILALAIMSVLSVVFGWAATIIPRIYTYYISTALFVIFGLKMLIEGYRMSPTGGQEEFEEVQSDLRRRDEQVEAEEKLKSIEKVVDKRESAASGGEVKEVEKEALAPGLSISVETVKKLSCLKISRIVAQAFTLTFLAEWGDRSQLATIILAAREDVFGVTFGSIFGHSLCTGLAVLSGRYLAEKISVRSVTILGGIVFLIFAITSLCMDPDDD